MKVLTMTKPVTGRHMLMTFLLFFGIVFAVNIFMAVMAVRSWTGLVVENSYVASQHFNEDVAALNKSAALGISHHMHFEKGKLFLSLQRADGESVNPDSVQISFERPFGVSREQIVTARRLSPGQYEATATLSAGVWNGELSAQIGGDGWWRQPFKLIVNGG